jgi:UDP-2,4-diacetamido-2,4,6-trideoxy-beta-L-altropyranose hydrolase
MKYDIMFRVDANAQIGLGHLLRCLALAQGLIAEKPNLKLVFVMHAESVELAKTRNDWLGDIQVLPASLRLKDEPLWLAEYVDKTAIKIFVLDGYQFSYSYRQAFAERSNIFKIVFDDNNDSGPLAADMVLNGANNAADMDYQQTAPKAVLCIGENYRILRQEFFQKTYILPWNQRSKLVVVMGGSDPKNMTLQIIEGLIARGFSDALTVVTGSAYQHISALKHVIHSSALQIEHMENCQEMALLFGQSRLVVSAAGGTQFELLACLTPALLLVVANNQLNATQESAKQGWCESIDTCLENDAQPIILRLWTLWNDQKILESMHQKANEWANTQGTSRVAKSILASVVGVTND